MHRRAGRVLDRRDRSQIDDGNDFSSHVRKTVAGRVQDFRRAVQFGATKLGEEMLDCGAPLRRAQVSARLLAALGGDCERVSCLIEGCA